MAYKLGTIVIGEDGSLTLAGPLTPPRLNTAQRDELSPTTIDLSGWEATLPYIFNAKYDALPPFGAVQVSPTQDTAQSTPGTGITPVQYSAVTQNLPSQDVTWTVQSGWGGSIDNTGLYSNTSFIAGGPTQFSWGGDSGSGTGIIDNSDLGEIASSWHIGAYQKYSPGTGYGHPTEIYVGRAATFVNGWNHAVPNAEVFPGDNSKIMAHIHIHAQNSYLVAGIHQTINAVPLRGMTLTAVAKVGAAATVSVTKNGIFPNDTPVQTGSNVLLAQASGGTANTLTVLTTSSFVVPNNANTLTISIYGPTHGGGGVSTWVSDASINDGGTEYLSNVSGSFGTSSNAGITTWGSTLPVHISDIITATSVDDNSKIGQSPIILYTEGSSPANPPPIVNPDGPLAILVTDSFGFYTIQIADGITTAGDIAPVLTSGGLPATAITPSQIANIADAPNYVASTTTVLGGLTVYNTDSNGLELWNSAKWLNLGTDLTSATDIVLTPHNGFTQIHGRDDSYQETDFYGTSGNYLGFKDAAGLAYQAQISANVDNYFEIRTINPLNEIRITQDQQGNNWFWTFDKFGFLESPIQTVAAISATTPNQGALAYASDADTDGALMIYTGAGWKIVTAVSI